MKKLLLSLLFITAAFITQAQDGKPTKEETQRFINSMLAKVIGEHSGYDDDPFFIKEQFFSISFDTYTLRDDDNDRTEITQSEKEISLIKWEALEACGKFVSKIPLASKKIAMVYLHFDSNMKESFTIDNDKPRIKFISQIKLIVPVEKVESVIKAFLRLREIAKEENKDPFEK